MPDARATVRSVDELLWALRRDGLRVSTAQAIDVARAVRVVGPEARGTLRDAVAAVVVQRPSDRIVFDQAFDGYFDGAGRGEGRADLWERLAARGATTAEIEALREALAGIAGGGSDGWAPLGALLEGGGELDRLLAVAGFATSVDAQSGPQLGFLTHRLMQRVGVGEARTSLGLLRGQLVDALGARGGLLADWLADELAKAEDSIRVHTRRAFESRVAAEERTRREHRVDLTPFAALSDAEIEDVRRAVRRLGERLRGGARVRARHARRGRIDPHRTLRQLLSTGGVPFSPARRARRQDRPKLVLLCDVSDSVRAAAAFLLEFTHAVHDLLDRVRSFVFVSELGETTDLFERFPVRTAIATAWGGGVVRAGDNSNYGRVLRAFAAEHLGELDRRTTVVVLGDGRTNYHDAGAPVLDAIRSRCKALLWLCPEPRGQWSQGDSAMAQYAARCTAVYEVRCAADLERVARTLVRRSG